MDTFLGTFWGFRSPNGLTEGHVLRCPPRFSPKRDVHPIYHHQYNLHKEHNGYQSQIPEHRYQSKTSVEHIEQVINKSLINSTNYFMNLLYFLHIRIIWCKYCKKYMRKSNQETFNFLVECIDMSHLTSQYR